MGAEVFEVTPGQWAYRVGGLYQEWHPDKDGFVAMSQAEAQALADLAAARVAGEYVEEVELEVSRAQAKAALLLTGKLHLVQPAIDAIPDDTLRGLVQIDWNDRLTFKRSNPTVGALAAMLGWSAQELDDLFALAATR